MLEGYGYILGSFVAWLNQVEGGGGTVFSDPAHDILVKKGSIGSAAFCTFWIGKDLGIKVLSILDFPF